jgi:hypothetical protein
MYVIFLVAIVTARFKLFLKPVFMAALTFGWLMLTPEWELSFVVVEIIFLPILRVVAILTLLTKLAFMHIILFVT